MNITIIHYDGFVSNRIIDDLKRKFYTINIIKKDYFDNQEKINIGIKNSDVILHIIDDYMLSLNEKKYHESLEFFSNVMEKIKKAIEINDDDKEKLFIQTSSSLVYRSKEINDERSINFANSLIANISHKIEEEANSLMKYNMKVSILRMANIVDKEHGIICHLRKCARVKIYPESMQGKRYFDWVHIDDVLSSISFIIEEKICGVINITAPCITSYLEISKLVKKNKHLFHLPDFIFKKILFYDYLVSHTDNKVLPKTLLFHDFKFIYDSANSLKKEFL